jgi:hypothetical protein
METAERNRKIKKVLSESFGAGNVTVRGSRGTAYGWVTVRINYTPRDSEHRREIEAMIWKLFDASGIKIDTYGYDDPGSDYGYGRKIHFEFNRIERPAHEQWTPESARARVGGTFGT